MIPYGRHSINKQDIDAVVDVLQHQFLTQGEQVPAFEKALCDYTGARFCTAVNSGTSGLHVACLALGIGKGDIVWTSPNSFAASANCALYCSASVDFVDINPITRNICPVTLEKKLQHAQINNCLPKAIVVVHFAGSSCDMQTIYSLCKPLKIAIIEDAAHALGASYLNKPVGCGEYSDIVVLSFHPVKSITTAEGGAVLSNDPMLAQKTTLFAKHGITRDSDLMDGDSHGAWYYQQIDLGFNYRLSDIHAALGISQLTRLDDFVQKRRKIARRYFEGLADLPVKLPAHYDIAQSSWHLFMVEVNPQKRREVYQALHNLGVAVNVHYIPIHLHPYYQNLGFEKGQFPVAENFYECALTLPIYPELNEIEQQNVITAMYEILS